MTAGEYSNWPSGIRTGSDGIVLGIGTAEPTKSNYIKLVGSGLTSYGSLWMESDGLHWSYNGTEKSITSSYSGGGGGVGVGDLDGVYSNGRAIALDEGAVVWTDATTSTANSMEFVQSGTKSGNILDFAVNAAMTGNVIDIDMNAGVGAKGLYIDGGGGTRTAVLFDMKHDGDGNVAAMNITATNTGTGPVIGVVMNGNGSGGGVFNIDMNAAVGAEAIYIDAGAGTRTADLISLKHDGNGNVDALYIADTNTGSGHVISIAVGGAKTGNVIDIDMNAGVGAKGLYIDGGNATRTADLIDVKHDGDGNADVFSVVATNTGSGAIFDINMDGNGSGGGVFNIDMNAALAAEVMNIDAGAGTRTANLFTISHDGNGNVDVFQIDDSNTGTGSVFDINMTGSNATGAVINCDMDTAIARPFLTLDYGNGIRTEDMVQITYDGSGTAPFFDINITNTGAGGTSDLFDIDVTGVFTGSILDVVYGAAATGTAVILNMTSAVGAAALAITGAGARTDDLIQIDDASTGAGARAIFDINITGAGTFPVLDISLGNAAVNATAILLTEGTGTATVPLIDINSAGTGATATLDIDYSGIFTGNCLDITYGTAAATGNAIDLNMGTNVAGMAISIASAATGTAHEGSAIDIAHTGNLAANADLVRIVSSGDVSSTTNLLYLESTGSAVAGSCALNINAGNDMEAIKVDAGTVTFDETLTVTGAVIHSSTLTQTGVATFATGLTQTAVGRIPTADGTTTAVIAAGTSVVQPTSADANHWLTLPTPVAGHMITILPDVGATGFEVRAADPANQYINNISGVNVELAVAATDTIIFICVVGGATGRWIAYKLDNLGAPATAGIAGA